MSYVNRWYYYLSKDPCTTLAMAATLLFAVLCLWQVLDFFISRAPVVAPPIVPLVAEEILTANAPLFHATIFGVYTPEPLAGTKIEEATVDVQLVGVLYDKVAKKSQVLLLMANGDQGLYGIDDTIPGGAIIKRIERRGVVIFYAGKLERLRFPNETLVFEAAPPPLLKDVTP